MICVLDTNAIINLCLLEVGGKRVYDYLIGMGVKIVVPSYLISDELNGALKKRKKQLTGHYDHLDDLEYYVNKKFKPVLFDGNEGCMQNINKWYTHTGNANDFEKYVQIGERKCLETALFLSRKNREIVVYITDDLLSRGNTGYLFDEQMVGWVWSTLDFILYLYSRYEHITKDQVRYSIQDFFNYCYLPDSSKKEVYINKLNLCCRSLGDTYSTCGRECFKERFQK